MELKHTLQTHQSLELLVVLVSREAWTIFTPHSSLRIGIMERWSEICFTAPILGNDYSLGLKLQNISESQWGLASTRLVGPITQSFWVNASVLGAWEFAFLVNSQNMLQLLVLGPHFENFYRVLYGWSSQEQRNIYPAPPSHIFLTRIFHPASGIQWPNVMSFLHWLQLLPINSRCWWVLRTQYMSRSSHTC